MTPEDIRAYDLPTHPLKEVDVQRAEDALKNDPFFQHYRKSADVIANPLRWAYAPSSRRSPSTGSTT